MHQLFQKLHTDSPWQELPAVIKETQEFLASGLPLEIRA
jgi:hypothetical protein